MHYLMICYVNPCTLCQNISQKYHPIDSVDIDLLSFSAGDIAITATDFAPGTPSKAIIVPCIHVDGSNVAMHCCIIHGMIIVPINHILILACMFSDTVGMWHYDQC